MMDREEIARRVRAMVADVMGLDMEEISMASRFVEDLEADSLDTIELVMEAEDQFEIAITDDEAEKLTTVGKAVDFIETALEAESE